MLARIPHRAIFSTRVHRLFVGFVIVIILSFPQIHSPHSDFAFPAELGNNVYNPAAGAQPNASGSPNAPSHTPSDGTSSGPFNPGATAFQPVRKLFINDFLRVLELQLSDHEFVFIPSQIPSFRAQENHRIRMGGFQSCR